MKQRWLVAAVTLGGISLPAHANSGVGMLMVAVPFMVTALIPAILIEGPIIARCLGTRLGRGFALATAANFVSTVLGAVIAVAIDAALLVPTGSSGWPFMMSTVLVALVPMFFLTWWLERMTVQSIEASAPKQQVGRAMWIANSITYALLAVFVIFTTPAQDPLAYRARLNEVLSEMGAAKVEVAEAFQAEGRFPKSLRVEPKSRYARRITLLPDGVIEAELKTPGGDEKERARIALAPRAEGGQILEWACYSPDIEPKYLPASCRQLWPPWKAPGKATK